MLQAHNTHKSYGSATVLAGASFILNDGEHVGLVGPNGSGKSTLLRIVTGEEAPDSGFITLTPRDLTVGYLPQAFAADSRETLGQVIAAANTALAEAECVLQRASDALAHASDHEEAMAAYADAVARFEALGGYDREHQAASVLQGLGLAGIDPLTPVRNLSGGQKTRLGLAALLLSEPDLLLLDEPTNHLDVEALEWLEGFVTAYRGAVLIVSHDRVFLDRTVTRILYLDPTSHAIKGYPGNYSYFAEAREQEREALLKTWVRQQEYIASAQADIVRLKNHAQAIDAATRGAKRATPKSSEEREGLDHYRKIASKRARLAKSRERKLGRYLESEERVDKPRPSWWLKLDFGPPPPGGRSVLSLEDVGFAYPGFPPLLRHVTLDIEFGERIALVGPNGAGKTTLMRLVEGTLQPTEGQVKLGTNIRPGRLAQEGETLDPDKRVLDTVREANPMSETDARNFLHFFLFSGDDALRRVGDCSLGERTRLQLALLVLRGCNLLLLDEPLNHLDIDGREHFQTALEAFEGTVVVVAHDRAFLRAYPERIIEVRDGAARDYQGGYEDYLAWRETLSR